MKATWVPAELTPATPEHVSRGYRTAITNLVAVPSDMAVAILHGHGALETWHFKTIYCNAPGNIKSGSEYEGLFTCFPILNEIIDGKTVYFTAEGELEGGPGTPVKGKRWPVPDGHPQSRFRAYTTLASGIEDKIRFLSTPNWRPALDQALKGNPDAYVRAIKARRYFTANVDKYSSAVVQLAQKYLPVAIATREQVAAPPLPPDSDELCRDMLDCFRLELPPELKARLRIHQAEHVDFALDVARADRDKEIQGD